MGLIERWKAPTPKFWKQVSNTSATLAGIAIAMMGADYFGKMILPTFSYTLHPITLIVCKNVFAIGCAIAIGARLAKQKILNDNEEQKP